MDRLVDDPELASASQAILRSADDDAPPHEARSKVARALGLGAAVGLTTTAASTTASSLSWWLVPAIVLGLATAGGIGVLGSRSTEAVAPPVIELGRWGTGDGEIEIETTATRFEVAVPAPATKPAKRVVVVEVPAPATPADPVVVALPPQPPPAPAIDARRLAAEVALLDRARAALVRGTPTAALAILDHHVAGFADGQLHAEASLLRIEAVLRTGDRALAEQLAGRFHDRFPGSPLARRVRSLISARQ